MLNKKILFFSLWVDTLIIFIYIVDVGDDKLFDFDEKFLEFWFLEFIKEEEQLVWTV